MKRMFDIKRMLIIVLVLNLLDGILTSWGLSNGWIEEANPIMSSFSPLMILCIKVVLSGLMFVLWKSDFPTRLIEAWRMILILVVGLYGYITLLQTIVM